MEWVDDRTLPRRLIRTGPYGQAPLSTATGPTRFPAAGAAAPTW
jgi:hypothetical protein